MGSAWSSWAFWARAGTLLFARMRDERLLQTAGSLTFTTALSLVPLVAVAFAVFTAFPAFGKFQLAVQGYLFDNLVPDSLARQVLQYLNQFAARAKGLTTLGLLFVVGAAVALLLTIDRSFNAIWHVRRPRPLAQRVLVYWAAITLGPLVLGAVASLLSYLAGASRGLFTRLPGWMTTLLEAGGVALVALSFAALYRMVPNTRVAWRDALAGGTCAALALELARRVFAAVITAQPVYASVYGAASAVPMFLLWLYLSWLIVLSGAVLAAIGPALRAAAGPTPGYAGRAFDDALAIVAQLRAGQRRGANVQGLEQLAAGLRREPEQLAEPLEALLALGWVGEIAPAPGVGGYALVCDPQHTPLAPLARRLLYGGTLEPLPLAPALDAPLAGWLPPLAAAAEPASDVADPDPPSLSNPEHGAQ
jgi:membrane protein